MPLTRPRRHLAALCAAAAIPAAAMAVPAVASASPMVESTNLAAATTSYRSLGSYKIAEVDPLATIFLNANVSASAKWTGTIPSTVTWNTSYLRQGATIGVGRMSQLQSGKLNVRWSVNGTLYKDFVTSGFNHSYSATASCAPMLAGSNYTCHAKTGKINLYLSSGQPGRPYANLVLHAHFVITPKGAVLSRTLQVGGLADPAPVSRSLNPTLQLDSMKVPCAGPVGSPVSYKLANLHVNPTVSATQKAELQEGFMDPVLGVVQQPAIFDQQFGGSVTTAPSFDLVGPGHTTSLGTMLANNVAPTISAVGPFTGTAGMPIALSASVSGRCSISDYTWKFSDGTVAFGAKPSKTFSKAGSYSGQLIVTDETGLKSSRNFTVTVS